VSGAPRANGNAGPPPATRQYVQFAFYKVDPEWRRITRDEREAAKQDLEQLVASLGGRMQVRTYSLTGIRADADLMFWHIADTLEPFQEAATRLFGTRLGPYLRPAYSYLAMTRKSVYVDKTESSAPSRRLRLTPGTSKYLFVYPFVKTRPWYVLSQEERQRMMDVHIRVGRKYPSVKLNTTYSFGLDDQEFVVAFETDEPGDFLDLVMELREAESSLYTLRDTPTFTCIATSPRGMLDALGAPGDVASAEPAGADGWSRAVDVADLPEGARRLVYAGGEQVLLLNAGGVVHALEARCPHGNGPLIEGEVADGVLTCPWHGSQFDLARGCEIVRGPAARPPRTWAVKVDSGGIYITPAPAHAPV
jgi:chlorite dismutase/nitrite reductase/ring-hydroxylating ferredoxin subunit